MEVSSMGEGSEKITPPIASPGSSKKLRGSNQGTVSGISTSRALKGWL